MKSKRPPPAAKLIGEGGELRHPLFQSVLRLQNWTISGLEALLHNLSQFQAPFWGVVESPAPGSSRALPAIYNIIRVLPGRTSGFRSGFRLDSSWESAKIGPPAGRRPAGIRPKSGPEARFPARKHYCVTYGKAAPPAGRNRPKTMPFLLGIPPRCGQGTRAAKSLLSTPEYFGLCTRASGPEIVHC